MIQDHVDHADHGASKERIFRARSFGRIRIRICDPRSRRSRLHQRNGSLGRVPLGGSGLGFVIQDHTDHGASKERIFRALSFGRIQIRICDPTSRRSRCMKGTKFKTSSQRIPKSALF